MQRQSAGLLMYRRGRSGLEVLLAHPGGPFFQNQDDAAWTIPKGEPEPAEDLLVAARREFQEETGITPCGPWMPLKPIRQKGGKIVHAWAFEGNCQTGPVPSNMFKLEWPPRSGQMQEFPEIDRIEFLPLALARRKIKAGQEALLDQLETLLSEHEAQEA